MVELTVPYNSPEALRNARQRRESKENYQLLLSELDRLGYRASLTTLEVGALGHSLPRSHAELRRLPPCVEKSKISQLFDKAGRISITCSHAIFRGRSELNWNEKKNTSNYLQQPQQPIYYLNLCLCFLNFVFQLFCPCQARSTLEPCRPRASFYMSHFHFKLRHSMYGLLCSLKLVFFPLRRLCIGEEGRTVQQYTEQNCHRILVEFESILKNEN